MSVVRAQELRRDPRVERITLGPALPEAIPRSVERLGIERVHPHPVIEQKIHHAPFRALDRGPQLDPLGPPFAELPTPLPQPRRRVRDRRATDSPPGLIA